MGNPDETPHIRTFSAEALTRIFKAGRVSRKNRDQQKLQDELVSLLVRHNYYRVLPKLFKNSADIAAALKKADFHIRSANKILHGHASNSMDDLLDAPGIESREQGAVIPAQVIVENYLLAAEELCGRIAKLLVWKHAGGKKGKGQQVRELFLLLDDVRINPFDEDFSPEIGTIIDLYLSCQFFGLRATWQKDLTILPSRAAKFAEQALQELELSGRSYTAEEIMGIWRRFVGRPSSYKRRSRK